MLEDPIQQQYVHTDGSYNKGIKLRGKPRWCG